MKRSAVGVVLISVATFSLGVANAGPAWAADTPAFRVVDSYVYPGSQPPVILVQYKTDAAIEIAAAGSCTATAIPILPGSEAVTDTVATPQRVPANTFFPGILRPTTSNIYRVTATCTVGGEPAGGGGPFSVAVTGLPAPNSTGLFNFGSS